MLFTHLELRGSIRGFLKFTAMAEWNCVVNEDRIWAHKIREAARVVRWRQVKRKNFPGAEDGIDTYTSGQLSRSTVLTPWEQCILRSIQSDAVWTCSKLHRAGKIVMPMCPACCQKSETVEHLLF